jgi:hypothetical protein
MNINDKAVGVLGTGQELRTKRDQLLQDEFSRCSEKYVASSIGVTTVPIEYNNDNKILEFNKKIMDEFKIYK